MCVNITSPRIPFLFPTIPFHVSLVNNSNELGQLEELTVNANETTITLPNLKYSTHYKFDFSAKTQTGSGPSIIAEFATITGTGTLLLLLHEIDLFTGLLHVIW